MGYIYYNPNPEKNVTGDCVVRALTLVLNEDWDTAYIGICTQGFLMKVMPATNSVWGAYLRQKGFVRLQIPNTCPDCYTVRDFCNENQNGTFLLATGEHVIAVIDGNYYDGWDSGDEVPIYFWKKK